MSSLLKKKCKPCEEGGPPLTLTEAKKLLKEIPEWKLSTDGRGISRKFDFRDFIDAIVFVNDVAQLAEEEGHHPNIFIHDYNKVQIELTTNAINGLSENDFILAAKINALDNDHEAHDK
ncbi:MAG: hypothetical protein RIQ56_610 [Candidatus Parcubacteria bacterium]|jgi:4a-hydroxytetrahydrobiopterin dehydratase